MTAALERVGAVVQVGCEETHYLRCGRGRETVIVVTLDDAERERLTRLFVPDYVVIAPLMEQSHPDWFDDAAALAAWLRGMIECLGIERPLVVVRGPAV